MGKMKESKDGSARIEEAEALIAELVSVMKDSGDWKHVDTPTRHRDIANVIIKAEEYKARWAQRKE